MTDDSMTVDTCIQHCKNTDPTMRYAGVQYSTECFCGDENSEYDRLGIVWDNECDAECGGNDYEICGGTWRLSIYDCKYAVTVLNLYPYAICLGHFIYKNEGMNECSQSSSS